MEAGIEWERESNVRAEKVQVATSLCDPGRAWWGSGQEERCEPSLEGQGGAERWELQG